MDEQNVTSRERFSHLEDKIYRVSEFFKKVLEQNQELKEEIEDLRRKCHELEERYTRIEKMIGTVRDEKDLIAEKIRSILTVLDTLEKR
jgi:cell division protein FtsB